MTAKKRNLFSEFWDHLVMKFSGLIWFVIVALLVWLLIQLLYLFFDFSLLGWFQTIPFLYPFVNYIYSEIAEKTSLGILYLFSISSLFIFPVPLEALFFTYIKGFNPMMFLILSTLGLYIGQIANYFLGRYFGFVFRFMFNNKTKKNIKLKISKYGGVGIVLMEMFPLPFQLFNFFAGAFKYNAKKFMFYSLVGLILKNLILFTIYVKFFA